jgi:hypothetical protein
MIIGNVMFQLFAMLGKANDKFWDEARKLVTDTVNGFPKVSELVEIFVQNGMCSTSVHKKWLSDWLVSLNLPASAEESVMDLSNAYTRELGKTIDQLPITNLKHPPSKYKLKPLEIADTQLIWADTTLFAKRYSSKGVSNIASTILPKFLVKEDADFIFSIINNSMQSLTPLVFEDKPRERSIPITADKSLKSV